MSAGARPTGAARRKGCVLRTEACHRGIWGSHARGCVRGTARGPGTWPSELCGDAGGALAAAAVAGPVAAAAGCSETPGLS